jgi:hypothetical protein
MEPLSILGKLSTADGSQDKRLALVKAFFDTPYSAHEEMRFRGLPCRSGHTISDESRKARQ